MCIRDRETDGRWRCEGRYGRCNRRLHFPRLHSLSCRGPAPIRSAAAGSAGRPLRGMSSMVEGSGMIVHKENDERSLGAEPSNVFDMVGLSVYYGEFRAVRDVNMQIRANEITALIGPSGCGKSTVLRTLNRMNDLIPSARIEGLVNYHGFDLYGADVDPVEVRRRIGMVFQKPNPFPKSIYDNVAWAPRILGMKAGLDDRVEPRLH